VTLEDAKPFLEDALAYASKFNFTPAAFRVEFKGGRGFIQASAAKGGVVLKAEGFPALRAPRPLPVEDFLGCMDALQAVVLQQLDGVARIPDDMTYPDSFITEGGA
jgi:hypothetical protein